MKKYTWHIATAAYVLSLQYMESGQAFWEKKDPPVECNDYLLPGQYHLKNGCNVTASGGALYWKAYEEGLDYVIKNNSGTAFINNDASVKRMELGWNWGFRIGLEYEIPHQKMDLESTWTSYVSTATSHSKAEFPATLFSVWTYPGAGISSETEAKAKARLKFNVVDLMMGATFSPRSFLDIKPRAGLASAWIDQKFNIHLSGGSTSSPALVLDDHIVLKNNFWGIGPKFGLNTTWSLGCGFNIIANVDISVLYGEFEIKQDETVLSSGLSPATTYVDVDSNRFHLLRAYLDMMLGLGWDHMFHNDRYHLSLQAGWENNILWGQNQLMRFITTSDPGVNVSGKGDLCIEGLTLKASFSF